MLTALLVGFGLAPPVVAQQLVMSKQEGLPVKVIRFQTELSDAEYTYGFEFSLIDGRLVRGIEWGFVVLDKACDIVLANVKTEQVLPRRPMDPDLDLKFVGSMEINAQQARAAEGGSQFFYIVAVEFLNHTKWLANAEDVAGQLESHMERCGQPQNTE